MADINVGAITEARAMNLTGCKFGLLTVIKRTDNDRHGKARWLCKCSCGGETIAISSDLKRGHTKSCGCVHLEKISHGNPKHNLANTKLYKVWAVMKDRCLNSKNKSYNNYGGRGITVCEEWRNDFKVFYGWAMNNGYSDGLSIDRIDNNGNYEPNNCRWATKRQQQLNTRRNKLITYNGKTQTLTEWSDELNIRFNKLWSRLYKLKWSAEQAFEKGGI